MRLSMLTVCVHAPIMVYVHVKVHVYVNSRKDKNFLTLPLLASKKEITALYCYTMPDYGVCHLFST